MTLQSFAQRARTFAAVDLPIPASVAKSAAVLFGLARNAFHSLSSVSVRAFVAAVVSVDSGTACNARVVSR